MVGRCRYHADCAGFWLLSMPSFMNRGRPWAVYPGQSVKALTLVLSLRERQPAGKISDLRPWAEGLVV
jgi:hypothetical protein